MSKPSALEKKIYNHRFYYVVRFNIRLTEDNEWEWEEISLPFGDPSYDSIVDAMVKYKYPADKMQAIINNYLLDPDESDVSEFINMQEWRKFSKSYAKQLLNH